MEDLNVTVGADISNFKRGMDDAQKELAQTALAAGKLDSALKRSVGGTNQAANALQNLGRVAQDAPFGFIGIQNNINPLLESFQRLKKETGSTTGAFKALVSQLGGAGGIGLAVSVATSVLTVLAQQGFFNTAKAADLAAESLKKFKDDIKGVYGEAGKEASTVSGLIAVLKNETETRERKNDALKELKKINPEVFGQLKQEEGAVIGLDTAYKNYLANFKLVIAAKILQLRLEAKTTELLKAQGIEQSSMTKAFDKIANSAAGGTASLNFFQKKNIETAKVTNRLNREISDLNNQLTELSKGVEVKTTKTPKAVKDVETVADVLAKLTRQLGVDADSAQARISDINSAISHLVDKFKLTASNPIIIQLEADIKTIKLQEQFKQLFKDIHNTPIPLSFEIQKGLQEAQERLRDAYKTQFAPAIQEAAKQNGLPLFNESDFDDNKKIAFLKGQGIGTAIQDGIKTTISGLRSPQLKKVFDEVTNEISALEGKLNALGTGIDFEGLNKKVLTVAVAVSDTLSPALDSLFESLANGGKNAFQSLGLALANIVKQLVITVGKAIVLGLVLSAITGQPFNITKVFTKAIGGFAKGGYIDGPGSKTSDSIPARLSRGEYVIKADSVSRYGKSFFDMINGGSFSRNNSYAGGGMVNGNIGGGQLITVVVEGQLKGTDMYLQNKRTALMMGRNS